MNYKKIALLSDSEHLKNVLSDLLANDFEVTWNCDLNLSPCLEEKVSFEYILVDFLLFNEFKRSWQDEAFYKEQLKTLKSFYPSTRILLLADQKQSEFAGKLLELGFNNIIQLPLSYEILKHRLSIEEERVRFQEVIIESSREIIAPKKLFESKNPQFAEVLSRIEKVAPSRSTILINGESGTGKSLLAKHIHQLSGREVHPFIEVHCGGIAENLVESELFGHEKGSFTGALRRKIGKFELSDNGTVFLDEIGTISKPIQVKMLQVLQERFIQRVGGEADIPLNLRVIAATNLDLKAAVKSGEFREDLFYRLNVFQVEIPPLRKRLEDIPFLCQVILEKLNLLYDKGIHGVSKEVLNVFYGYNWPGNVRELENILERAYVLETEDEISTMNIPSELIPAAREVADISPLTRSNLGLVEARKEASEAFEKRYLTELLIAHHGKVALMAKEAQVSTRQLHKLMSKHQIKAKDFHLSITEEEL